MLIVSFLVLFLCYVECTILAIIDEFFVSNLNALLYICDTSDHRKEARNRFFLTGSEHNGETGTFYYPYCQCRSRG